MHGKKASDKLVEYDPNKYPNKSLNYQKFGHWEFGG